jgi:hypothetical protein
MRTIKAKIQYAHLCESDSLPRPYQLRECEVELEGSMQDWGPDWVARLGGRVIGDGADPKEALGSAEYWLMNWSRHYYQAQGRTAPAPETILVDSPPSLC